MRFDLKRPCANCPFRSDIKPFLTTMRVREIIAALVGGRTFSCHKTVDYSEDSDGVETGKTQHCAGALILLERMGKPNQLMRVAERLGFYNRHGLDMQAKVYQSPKHMIQAHDKGQPKFSRSKAQKWYSDYKPKRFSGGKVGGE